MIKRLRRRRAQARDVAAMDPDRAAQLCRTLSRAGVADRPTLILLARRGQDSELPGNAAAMRKYEAAFRAGRRIKYTTYPVDFRFQHVPDDLRVAVEDALTGDEHGQINS